MLCPGGSGLDQGWRISGRQPKQFDYWQDSSLHHRITINLLNAIMAIQPYKKMLLFGEMHIDIFRRGTSNWVKFYKVHMSQSSRTVSLNGWPFFTNSTFFSTSRHLFKPSLLPLANSKSAFKISASPLLYSTPITWHCHDSFKISLPVGLQILLDGPGVLANQYNGITA